MKNLDLHIENIVGIHLVPSHDFLNHLSSLEPPANDLRPAHLQPHLTLAMGRIFSPGDIQDLFLEVKTIAMQPVFLETKEIVHKFSANKKNLYFQIIFSQSDQLSNYHRLAIEIINCYRPSHLIREKDLKKYLNGHICQKEYEHIEKYGYLNSMEFYRPHITLGMFAGNNNADSIQKYYSVNLFPTRQLIIFDRVEVVLTPQNLITKDFLSPSILTTHLG